MKLTAWRVLVTVLVMATLLNLTMATTTQAVLCAGSGGLLLGVGIGLGKHHVITFLESWNCDSYPQASAT